MKKRRIDNELNLLIQTALQNGLTLSDIERNMPFSDIPAPLHKEKSTNKLRVLFTCVLIILLYVLKHPDIYHEPRNLWSDLLEDYWFSPNETCFLYHSGLTIEITRPLSKCTLCEGLTQVPVAQNMTPEWFLKHHAYTGIPVLIKNSVTQWSAFQFFSFQFFKDLYDDLDAYEENNDLGCQFFPYKTNFHDLKQVLHMSKERASLEKDQWYIGWSNCVPRVMKSLRKHYERPHFLPQDSESSHLDWMFMGGSGTGADMHIDAVNRPSWQAMIKGKKTWYFEPPPECESVCKRHLNATLEPGDILVVDTNRWYHSTYIHPGDLSITIGSEYD